MLLVCGSASWKVGCLPVEVLSLAFQSGPGCACGLVLLHTLRSIGSQVDTCCNASVQVWCGTDGSTTPITSQPSSRIDVQLCASKNMHNNCCQQLHKTCHLESSTHTTNTRSACAPILVQRPPSPDTRVTITHMLHHPCCREAV